MHSGNKNPTIPSEASWVAVVQAISNGGLGAVNVINSNGNLIGIITDGDLRRAIQSREHAAVRRFEGRRDHDA